MEKDQIIELLSSKHGEIIELYQNSELIRFETDSVDNIGKDDEGIICTLEGLDNDDIGYHVTIIVNSKTGELVDWFDIEES